MNDDISEVLIENQPSLKNPKMKTMSAILYSYFIMRGIIDNKNSIEEVRFISPSNKLKVNSKVTNSLLEKEQKKSDNDDKNKKNVYKLTKSLGIKYCKALICEKDTNILDNFKKKDDMCDAFLQGFQYLFSPVPEKYFCKLEKIGFSDDTVKSSKSQENNDEKPKKKSKSKKAIKSVAHNSDNDDNDVNDEKPKKIQKSKK